MAANRKMAALHRILPYLTLLSTLAHAQTTATPLSYPSIDSFSLQAMPLAFAFPPTASLAVSVSVALCSNTQPSPRFFITNSTTDETSAPGPNDPNASEITLDAGVGGWMGQMRNGGLLGVWVGQASQIPAGTSWPFEIAAQEEASAPHSSHPLPPLLGDTTSTQAIVFSPPFERSLRPPPTYPNYTLIPASPDSERPQYEPPTSVIVLNSTDSLSSFSLSRSSCALRQQFQQQVQQLNVSKSIVLRDHAAGWRSEFVLQNLKPATNYTLYITQGPKISGPLYVHTKLPDFPCTMVHALPYCPIVSYPIPLPSTSPSFLYDSTTLPESISSSILSTLGNFTSSLMTFPCGRDMYSPLRSCVDCFDAYQAWACSVSLPRCGEPALTIENPRPLPLVERLAGSTPRAAGFPVSDSQYYELLPCIESCYSVARSCPPFLGWHCPNPRFNADQTYGLGFIDSQDGVRGGQGLVGQPSDRFGTVWCNGVES